ncbi:TetR/AcrR family transcriptional regulator C-terminal domain-containing protein [Curtobacterium flaccumfaciens]|nr:TetR/AcrR family transcriptional regulator C-terminal domain-containing protein [Curtobacterium flaccumfaciens]
MAEAAMRPHARAPLPAPGEDWREWFVENTRSFRRTLLARRDGARLHAGSMPQGDDFERGVRKLAFLVDSGLPEAEAAAAMLASGRFTIGSVLEEQNEADRASTDTSALGSIPHAEAFEAGLLLILRGMEQCIPRPCR